jgi:recombination protein RecT
MTSDEVEVIRSKSKAAKSGPWVNHWDEMAKKTVFRRLSKWIELSPEFRDSVERDHDTIDAEFTHTERKSLSDLTQQLKALEQTPAKITDDSQGPHIEEESQEQPDERETFLIDAQSVLDECSTNEEVNQWLDIYLAKVGEEDKETISDMAGKQRIKIKKK